MSKRWFLPETPDVLATLHEQADVTRRGLSAFVAWSAGDAAQADVLRQAEHEADDVRRHLAQQLRNAFTTPVDQEDLFTLSERLDTVINTAKNVVREADLLGVTPTPITGRLAEEALAGVENLAAAFDVLLDDPDAATARADAATKCGRHMEKLYVRGIQEIASLPDFHDALPMREHYQRCLRIGECIEMVADRIWYAVVKEA